jgi:predicted neuraminidase
MKTLLLILTLAMAAAAADPIYESRLIIPLDKLHVHSSSIVELPNGDLLTCWYKGSGERTADDVRVLAARRRRGEDFWDEPYVIADKPHFPDTNPILFVDSNERLWLMWSTIVANRWESALTRYSVSAGGWDVDPPRWHLSDSLLIVPRNFEERVKAFLGPRLDDRPDDAAYREAKHAFDFAGDKYFSRMGWMARIHPLELPSGRVLVPLYSDGYNFSLIAITDDGGESWFASEPLVSEGGVQPSLIRRQDGAIVAYMRDNGPPPQRVLSSVSRDDGVTWSPVVDSDIPNPGSSIEVIALDDGLWAAVNNPTSKGRHKLSIWLSDDEGESWRWKRDLEHDTRGEGAGGFSYPSVIQTRDGMIHVTYSYAMKHLPKGAARESIKHAIFSVDWVKAAE